jgi:hypothetical protein
MNLQQRIELMVRLGEYMLTNDKSWETAKQKAFHSNNWFIPEFINLSVKTIATRFLQPEPLQAMVDQYKIPDRNPAPKRVGIVMAGNIPLVGFHDLLCVFLSGHIAMVKPSSKDEDLIRHIVLKLKEWQPQMENEIMISEMIRDCDAYIATGSNNSAQLFDYYFKKYPSIIRRNRTSVAILTGRENREELERLADDVYQYFGLGCRNVTKIYVPEGYDFIPLLEAFRKYGYLANHHKYKNNYDYNLTAHILNNRYYMSNDSLILVEDVSPFSPIAQLHYEYYKDANQVNNDLNKNEAIQCVVGADKIAFGQAQRPGLCDYADGVDTMRFLMSLQ